MLGKHLSEQEFEEIECSICLIEQLADVVLDYCEHNMDYEKICPLLPVISQMKLEITKISNKI